MEDKLKESYEKITISEEAKERIRMAIKMEDEKKPSWSRTLRKQSCKLAVAACLTVILVPTGVYAGTRIYQSFQSTVTTNNREVNMEMNKVETSKPATSQKFVKITADFGKDYRAEKVSNDGAWQGYEYKGGFDAGKSFWYETIYMDGDQKASFKTYNNDESEQIMINGRKASYCKSGNVNGTQYSADHLTEYGQSIYIFVEEYGYVIRMGAQLNLGKEGFIKQAEKLMITEASSKKDATGYTCYSDIAKCGWEVRDESESQIPIDTSCYYTDGTAKLKGGTIKVTDVKVLDSVASLGKISSTQWNDSSEYNKLFDKDGKLKSYQREKVKVGDGITSPERQVEKTETVQPKLVYVTAEVENVESFDGEYQVPSLCLLSEEDGIVYQYDNDNNYNRPAHISDAFMDNMPCYFKESMGGKHFYFTKAKKGKTIMHYAYLVDEDQVNKMALSLNDAAGRNGQHIYLDISQK